MCLKRWMIRVCDRHLRSRPLRLVPLHALRPCAAGWLCSVAQPSTAMRQCLILRNGLGIGDGQRQLGPGRAH